MVLAIILFVITAGFILERWLHYLNKKHQQPAVPEEMEDVYPEDVYRKSIAYEMANSNFENITSTFSFILTLVLITSGFFAKLDEWTKTISGDLVWSTLLFFGLMAFLSDMINTPFAFYKTFVIEERFGFNRSTIKLFFTDKLKGYLLAGILGGSLLAIFVLFYQIAGNNFWWYAWITFSIVSIVLSMFYASIILPLFNKLKPLGEGELRNSIEAYCRKVNFRLDNLFIMDGSKRSAKANAFFSGLGGKKKIVLFDTLIEKHTNEELIAVLAHEIGHYKKKHTRTGILLSILQTGLMLYLLSWFINQPALAQALGGRESSFALGLLAFTILYSPLSTIIGITMNVLSRKHEFEADAYAAVTFNAQSLKSALKKLSADNLSNLTPHPWYVFFYYSHPPLLQRLKNLDKY